MSVADFAKNRRDLRDPKILGEELLERRKHYPTQPLHAVHLNPRCPDYNANPSCLDKYGRPQDLPETPF